MQSEGGDKGGGMREGRGREATNAARARPVRNGPYVWGPQIGRGGMAEVTLARRERTEDFAEFAAKRILPRYAGRRRYVRMFCEEAALGFLLDHPNIVRTLDFGEQDGELVLVMEYVDGLSCRHLMRLAATRHVSFPLPVALFIASEVLNALEHAHDVRGPEGRPLGVVHRDVSPGNILVSRAGEVKLTDFGVARRDGGLGDTRPGMLKGKCGYMSPEQIEGGPIDRRSDLFSLGSVLFEMLVGRPLFTGRSEFEILSRAHASDLSALVAARAALPLELRLILATALARAPEDRFQRAEEFRDAIGEFCAHARLDPSPDALIRWLTHLDVTPTQSGTFPLLRPRELDGERAPSLSVVPRAAGRGERR